MVLLTTELQHKAVRIYERAGFTLVGEPDDDTLGLGAREQFWAVDL